MDEDIGVAGDRIKKVAEILQDYFKDTRQHNVSYSDKIDYVKYQYLERQECEPSNKCSIYTESKYDPISLTANATFRAAANENRDGVVMVVPLSKSRGNGVENGTGGVEADLCIRTNYWKALGNLDKEHDFYNTVRDGDVVHIPNVTIIKDVAYKRQKINDRRKINIIGVVLPIKPDKMDISLGSASEHGIFSVREIYNSKSDQRVAEHTLSVLFDMCKQFNYTHVIFNNYGISPNRQPIDQLAEYILYYSCRFPIKYIIYVGDSGETTGMDKSKRYDWIKWCKLLDCKDDRLSNEDCEYPKEEEDDRPIKRVVGDNKRVIKDDDESGEE